MISSVNLAGGHFYTSGAFWGVAAGVIVGVLGIAATVWVTLRAANPKRRLYYWLAADTALITRRQDLADKLRVIYGSHQLYSPRVVTVRLTSRGRRDISREAFDESVPLCLDLGTHIVECIAVTTSPKDRPNPACTINDSKLLIGPSHFGKRQTTSFSLLVDGESPRIVPPPQSLVDVNIEHGDADGTLASKYSGLLAGLGVGFGVTASILVPMWLISRGYGVAGLAILAVVSGAAISASLVPFRRRD